MASTKPRAVRRPQTIVFQPAPGLGRTSHRWLSAFWSWPNTPEAPNSAMATPTTMPSTPEPERPALAIIASIASAPSRPSIPSISPTIRPWAASSPNASPATETATSSSGASEKTA